MTSPVAPSPLHFAVDLPAVPTGTLLDVDNDGEEDTGVQIFRIDMGANINGGSHQEQLDQAGGLSSYLTDPVSGQITDGSLLVYAPDAEQGFPSGFGADGQLFTADDPAVGLPQGYTVVHFGPDGFTFERAVEGGDQHSRNCRIVITRLLQAGHRREFQQPDRSPGRAVLVHRTAWPGLGSDPRRVPAAGG